MSNPLAKGAMAGIAALAVCQGNFALWSAEERRGRGQRGKTYCNVSPLLPCLPPRSNFGLVHY
ncbi:MAG: hypothetical protein RMY33_024145 [Nostoc sp. DedQUE03]|nr:hypothetical protein [Nostoc sp. DedQUE03]MDZ8046272.1 hypothetical protein [Nostoc sp. DedQUE02]